VEIFPGPYRNYFVIPDVKTMEHVEDWLLGIIEDEGPFDGVFGFSEVRRPSEDFYALVLLTSSRVVLSPMQL
jgi:hypothetical protein